MSEGQIEQLLTDYYANLGAIDLEGWLKTMAEDAIIYDPVGTPPLKVKEGSRHFFDILSRYYEKFEIVQDHVFIVDRGAAVKWTMNVTTKNGRTAKAEGISTFEINSQGKIQNLYSYWDEMGMKAQLIG